MRTLKILIIRNGVNYPVDISLFRTWVSGKLDAALDAAERQSLLPLRFKDTGARIGGDAGDATWWGLDGVKEQIRDAGLVAQWRYHAVFFLYDIDTWPCKEGPVANLTYPNRLNGAAFVEIPMQAGRRNAMDVAVALSHEVIHAIHRICWWRGFPTNDTMDVYDKDAELDAVDGNRARNLAVLAPYLDAMLELPVWDALEAIKGKLIALLAIVKAMGPAKSRIKEWADAIEAYENMGARFNNPGALRWSPTQDSTLDGYAHFATYAIGRKALEDQLIIAANERLDDSSYRPEMTLIQFFARYSPSADGNDPNAYALFVAQRLKVDPTVQISTLS